MVFSKIKALQRKAAQRSVDEPWARIGALLDRFSAHKCSSYFKHAGYA